MYNLSEEVPESGSARSHAHGIGRLALISSLIKVRCCSLEALCGEADHTAPPTHRPCQRIARHASFFLSGSALLLTDALLCEQANGAGKSTLIKMLTGETQPNEGSVWKHPNTRVAYVAQHAFHHLEQVRLLHVVAFISWSNSHGQKIMQLAQHAFDH